jgi:hypothetical protein
LPRGRAVEAGERDPQSCLGLLPRRSTVPGRGRAGDGPPASQRSRGRVRLPCASAVAVDVLRPQEAAEVGPSAPRRGADVQGPWKDVDQVERTIFQWITWCATTNVSTSHPTTYRPPSTNASSGRARNKHPSPPETRSPDSTKLWAAHKGAPTASRLRGSCSVRQGLVTLGPGGVLDARRGPLRRLCVTGPVLLGRSRCVAGRVRISRRARDRPAWGWPRRQSPAPARVLCP